MATVKAVISKSKKNSKDECLVFVRYGHQQKTMEISTLVRTDLNHWNPKKEIINSASKIANTKANEALIKTLKKNDAIGNTRISEIKSQVISIANEILLKEGNPDIKTVKDQYILQQTKKTSTKVEVSRNSLIPTFSEYILSMNKSEGTKKNFSTTLHHLKEFEAFKKRKLTISDFSLNTYDELTHFLLHNLIKQDGGIGLADNTVGTSIKNLKTFLRHCKKRGHKVEVDFTEMKVLKQKKPIYHLTVKEVEKLGEMNFEASRHQKVKDLFVFNCYTGLRYSDLSRLREFHIQDGIIRTRAFKNQKNLRIPLTPKAKEILFKYDYQLPDLSEQKFNKYIKEACKIAEIDTKVEKIRSSSGNKQYEYVPKWQVISTHIAVKTFISMCCEKGISPKVVAEVSGRSLKVIIDHYYGVDTKTIDEQMMRAFG